MKFSEWIEEYADGALDDDLSAALEEVAQQVVLMGKAGALSLTLKLSTKGDGVLVTADVNAKPPKHDRQLFYFARNGELTRRDPNQPQIPGTEAPARNKETDTNA